MKMGEHTPELVRRSVRRLAGKSPRPTNKVIQQSIEEEFGEDISDKTVRNICERAGLPTSSLPTSGSRSWAAQMETSGHWPNLRQTAIELSTQLFLPLTQALQFP